MWIAMFDIFCCLRILCECVRSIFVSIFFFLKPDNLCPRSLHANRWHIVCHALEYFLENHIFLKKKKKLILAKKTRTNDSYFAEEVTFIVFALCFPESKRYLQKTIDVISSEGSTCYLFFYY